MVYRTQAKGGEGIQAISVGSIVEVLLGVRVLVGSDVGEAVAVWVGSVAVGVTAVSVGLGWTVGVSTSSLDGSTSSSLNRAPLLAVVVMVGCVVCSSAGWMTTAVSDSTGKTAVSGVGVTLPCRLARPRININTSRSKKSSTITGMTIFNVLGCRSLFNPLSQMGGGGGGGADSSVIACSMARIWASTVSKRLHSFCQMLS